MDGVIFWDFDGTLSYPNKSFQTALHLALAEQGYSFCAEESSRFLDGFYSWRSPQTAYPHKVKALWWQTHFQKIRQFCTQNHIPESSVPKICQAFKAILTDVSNYTLYPDTVAALQSCRELGLRNYLITNNYPEIGDNLEKLGIGSFFSGMVISSHIGYEKPRAEFFDWAKQLAGYPGQGFVVGDNPIADIRGGKEAGFTTIAVHACTESCADHYCPTLLQIIPLVTPEK